MTDATARLEIIADIKSLIEERLRSMSSSVEDFGDDARRAFQRAERQLLQLEKTLNRFQNQARQEQLIEQFGGNKLTEALQGFNLQRFQQAQAILKNTNVELTNIRRSAEAIDSVRLTFFQRFRQQAARSLVPVQRQLVALRNTIDEKLSKTFRSMAVQLLGFFLIFNQITKATRDALQFSEAIGQIATITDQTTAELAEMRGEIQAIARDFGGDEVDVAKGAYFALSSGIESTSEALTLVEKATELATSGFAETATVIDLLTSTINAYGLSVQDADRLNAIFFSTVELGKAELNELANNMGAVLPLSSQLNVSIEEVTGAIATLTLGGRNADEAITGLRQLLINLQNPTADATALIDEANNRMDAFGGRSLAAKLQADGLVETITALRGAYGDNNAALREIIPDARGLVTVLALVGNQYDDLTRIVAENSTNLESQSSALSKALEIPAVRARIVLAGIRQGFIGLGDEIIDSMLPAGQTIDQVRERSDEFKQTIESLAPVIEIALSAIQIFVGGLTALGAAVVLVARGIDILITRFDGSADAAERAARKQGELLRLMADAAVFIDEISPSEASGSARSFFEQLFDDERQVLVQTRTRIDELRSEIKALEEQFAALSAVPVEPDGLEGFLGLVDEGLTTLGSLSGGLLEFAPSLREAYAGSSSEAEQAAMKLVELREELEKLQEREASIEGLTGALDRNAQALRDAEQDARNLVSAYDLLQRTGPLNPGVQSELDLAVAASGFQVSAPQSVQGPFASPEEQEAAIRAQLELNSAQGRALQQLRETYIDVDAAAADYARTLDRKVAADTTSARSTEELIAAQEQLVASLKVDQEIETLIQRVRQLGDRGSQVIANIGQGVVRAQAEALGEDADKLLRSIDFDAAINAMFSRVDELQRRRLSLVQGFQADQAQLQVDLLEGNLGPRGSEQEQDNFTRLSEARRAVFELERAELDRLITVEKGRQGVLNQIAPLLEISIQLSGQVARARRDEVRAAEQQAAAEEVRQRVMSSLNLSQREVLSGRLANARAIAQETKELLLNNDITADQALEIAAYLRRLKGQIETEQRLNRVQRDRLRTLQQLGPAALAAQAAISSAALVQRQLAASEDDPTAALGEQAQQFLSSTLTITARDEADALRAGVKAIEAQIASLERANAIRPESIEQLRALTQNVREFALAETEAAAEAQELDEALRSLGFAGGFTAGLQDFAEIAGDTFEQARLLALGLGDAITNSVGDAFADMVSGAKNAREAFADFARGLSADIARLIGRFLALQAVSAFLPGFGLGLGGFGGGGGTPAGPFPLELATGGIVPGEMKSPRSVPFRSFEDGGVMLGQMVRAFEKGGVMQGQMQEQLGGLPIRAYQQGGVATTPQLALFAEKPGAAEAFVPLPGPNRGIPVEFQNLPDPSDVALPTGLVEAIMGSGEAMRMASRSLEGAASSMAAFQGATAQSAVRLDDAAQATMEAAVERQGASLPQAAQAAPPTIGVTAQAGEQLERVAAAIERAAEVLQPPGAAVGGPEEIERLALSVPAQQDPIEAALRVQSAASQRQRIVEEGERTRQFLATGPARRPATGSNVEVQSDSQRLVIEINMNNEIKALDSKDVGEALEAQARRVGQIVASELASGGNNELRQTVVETVRT